MYRSLERTPGWRWAVREGVGGWGLGVGGWGWRLGVGGLEFESWELDSEGGELRVVPSLCPQRARWSGPAVTSTI